MKQKLQKEAEEEKAKDKKIAEQLAAQAALLAQKNKVEKEK